MQFVYFVLVLGITILIHELGHFLFAKKFGVHVYEFSIGMGPKLFEFRRKNDETIYSIRAFPIGGFVQMAGEDINEDKAVSYDKTIGAKKLYQKSLIIAAGVIFNFILAILIFFTVAMTLGASDEKAYIKEVSDETVISKEAEGSKIIEFNGKKVTSIDTFVLDLHINKGAKAVFTVENDAGVQDYAVTPKKTDEGYNYGFRLSSKGETGIIPSIKFAFVKTKNLIEQMVLVLVYLFTGKLSIDSLSGPIGIFNIVGETAKAGLISVVYLIGFLSVNVGFINLIPFPAFDGGRLLFLAIEAIFKKPVNPRVENIIHTVGFMLLMGLMLFITFNDILKLF